MTGCMEPDAPHRCAMRLAWRISLTTTVLCGAAGMVLAAEGPRPARPAADKAALNGLMKPAFLQAPFVTATKSARLQQLQSLVDSKDWLKDPFRHLQTDMVDVIDDLAISRTHPPAHVTQPKIISRLDKLIELLEKQCKAGGGGNSSPLRRSILAGGPGGVGDLNAPRNRRPKWAELTAKERERILQSRTEGFPAGYEEILGEYYRRLATEDSVRAIAPGAAKPSAGTASPGKSP